MLVRLTRLQLHRPCLILSVKCMTLEWIDGVIALDPTYTQWYH